MARYHGLAALKEDSVKFGAMGVGIVAGAGVAKVVTGMLDKAVRKSDAPGEYMFPGAQQVVALVPAAVGLFLVQPFLGNRGPEAAKDAVAGVTAGMVAYSIGSLVASFVSKENADKFLPFNGLAGDGVYDYSLGASSEFGPGGVEAYMMNGFGDAPTTTEVLNGAAVDIQPFNGLGSAPVSVSTYAPLNTALTA